VASLFSLVRNAASFEEELSHSFKSSRSQLEVPRRGGRQEPLILQQLRGKGERANLAVSRWHPHASVPSPPFSFGRVCRGPRSGARALGLLGWGPFGPCLRLVVGALLGPACACFWAWAGALLNAFLWVLDTSNGVGCSHLAFRILEGVMS
jgi:hypothetical protein